jgi:hypothetical protein
MTGRLRARAVRGLLALVAVGVALGAPPSSAAPPTPFPVECKLPGTHYAGTTRQTHLVCLTVFATGKAVREYSFGSRFTCSDGKVRPGATTVHAGSSFTRIGGFFVGTERVRAAPIATTGAFTSTILPGPDPATFTGKILRSGVAAGTFRLKVVSVDGGSLNCDTGTVAWRASKPKP